MKILFAGDFIPSEEVTIEPELEKLIRNADYSFVNLETPLTNASVPIFKNGISFKTNPKLISKVKEFGFNGVTLSNNHIRDYGNEGVLDTIRTCEDNNVYSVGAGDNIISARMPLCIEKSGIQVSVINVSEWEFNIADEARAGANPYQTIDTYYQIKEAQKKSNKIIVVYHGGLEYHNYPLPGIKKHIEFLVESGADAVICHHTHYISGFKSYMNKPIFWGLGNFYIRYVSKNKVSNPNLHTGLIACLEIDSSDEIKYSVQVVEKSANQKQIRLKKDQHTLLNQLENYNKIINSRKLLEAYWNDEKKHYAVAYYSKLRNKNRIMSYLFRKIGYSNADQLMKVSNLFSCDSHREMIVKSFKKDI